MDAKVSSWACTLSKYSANAVDCGAMWYIFGSGLVVLAGIHKNLNNETKEACKNVCACTYVCVCVCVCVCEHGFNMER